MVTESNDLALFRANRITQLEQESVVDSISDVGSQPATIIHDDKTAIILTKMQKQQQLIMIKGRRMPMRMKKKSKAPQTYRLYQLGEIPVFTSLQQLSFVATMLYHLNHLKNIALNTLVNAEKSLVNAS